MLGPGPGRRHGELPNRGLARPQNVFSEYIGPPVERWRACVLPGHLGTGQIFITRSGGGEVWDAGRLPGRWDKTWQSGPGTNFLGSLAHTVYFAKYSLLKLGLDAPILIWLKLWKQNFVIKTTKNRIGSCQKCTKIMLTTCFLQGRCHYHHFVQINTHISSFTCLQCITGHVRKRIGIKQAGNWTHKFMSKEFSFF